MYFLYFDTFAPELLSHRSCHAKQTLHDAFGQTSQSVTVSQNVIYVMQKRGKNIYKRRSRSAGLERVERQRFEGVYRIYQQ